MLDGAHKYFVEGYGLQVAKMGLTFETIPTVLRIRLRRWVYDPQTRGLAKARNHDSQL
jgi:ubiquitin carboxyl-terminal hydrolase 7